MDMEDGGDLDHGENVINSTEIDDDLIPPVDPSILAFDGISDNGNRQGSTTPTATQDLVYVTQPLQNELKLNGLASNQLDEPLSSQDELSRSSSSDDLRHDHAIGEIIAPPQIVTVRIPKSRYNALPYSTSQTGLVYDARMRFHTELKPSGGFHPEDPSRISEIFQELVSAGLYRDSVEGEKSLLPEDMQLARISCRQATISEISLVHTLAHINWVRSLASQTSEALVEEEEHRDSVYLHFQTWLCATLSAGGAIEATRAVVSGQVKNAIAVIRPPGHHAEHANAGGFCFFNNVCIGARVCQAEFSNECRKVLILDWDVHHGNGVQQVFYDDPNVLYISIHVYQNGAFYPGGDYGDHKHCGAGAGLGKNVNIPWPTAGMTDADYICAFQKIVMPIAVEFDPDLVMIAAGFDAAEGDPLGQCHVSPAGYAHMTHMLMQLAKGKVVACLEGGYNLRSIAKSYLSMTRTLMGEPPERLAPDLVPNSACINTVQLVMRQQAKFWKCMYPKNSLSRSEFIGERLHDIMRFWQSEVLMKEYHMTEMFIMRQKISKSFEKQVLATPDYNTRRPLLILFRDPPDALGIPDPRTSKLELHNTWIADASKTYIDWAVKNGFGVIDVNIPKYITGIEDENEYEDPDQARASMTKELAIYLWENYIDVGEATHIFILGIGESCSGIVELLKSADDCLDKVDCFFSILSEENSLKRVIRDDDEYAGVKYFRTSLVFVHAAHPIWALPPSKIRKSHGKLHRSQHTDLTDMMLGHKAEIIERMLADTEDWRVETSQYGESEMELTSHPGENMPVQLHFGDQMETDPLPAPSPLPPFSPPPPPEPAFASLPVPVAAAPGLAPPPGVVTTRKSPAASGRSTPGRSDADIAAAFEMRRG